MEFYVYVHKKKTDGEVFYVGKGKGFRAWVTTYRSSFWTSVFEKHGRDVEIVVDNLSEEEALNLERELISFYGRRDTGTGVLVNLCDGGKGSSGAVRTQEYKDNVSKRISGTNHPRFDPREWTFYNFKTTQTVISTKYSFGREFSDVSVGTLFTEKGTHKGWVVKEVISECDLNRMVAGYCGVHNRNADKTEYEFINVFTFERLSGTRHDLMDRVENFNASAVILGTVRVSKGWTLVEVFNAHPIEFLQNPSLLDKNPKADKTVYEFVQLQTGEEFLGTRTEFQRKYGFTVRDLFQKQTNYSVKGWCLKARLHEVIVHVQKDYSVYSFIHIDGTEFVGTRSEFKEKFGYHLKPLFSKKPFKTCKGWSLSPQQPE